MKSALLLVLLVALFVIACYLLYCLVQDAWFTLQDEYRDKHGIEDALRVFYKYRKH